VRPAGYRVAMTPTAWALLAAAAVCAGVVAPRARRSRPALAVAGTGAAVVLAGVVYAALGYGGCARRGDCGALGDALLTVIAVGLLVLPVLLLVAAAKWAWRQVRPGMARGGPRLGRVDHDYTPALALAVDGSRAKLHLMRAGVALFAATSVLMALAPEPFADYPGEEQKVRLVSIACAALFGAVLLIGFFTMRHRFRLALLRDGLRWEAGASPAFVAWDDLAGASLIDIHGTKFLGVDVSGPDALKTTRAQRRIARFSRPIAGADASIALEPFPVDPERLVAAIAAYAQEPALRHEIGTAQSLARLTGGTL
jgi:hypothetical protein